MRRAIGNNYGENYVRAPDNYQVLAPVDVGGSLDSGCVANSGAYLSDTRSNSALR